MKSRSSGNTLKTYTSKNKARKHIKMDEFLSFYVLLKFSSEDINNLNRFLTVNDIETVVKVSTRRSQGPPSITVEFYQTFEDNLIHIVLK